MKKLLFLLPIIIWSCGKNLHTGNVIDLLSTPVSKITNLSEIATDINYIPLETNDSCLINRIFDFRVIGENYYIATLSAVYCFDKYGKYILKLDKKGRGPEEYANLSDFDVSQDNKFLAVSTGKSLAIFNIKNSGFSFFRKIPFSQSPSRISFTGSENNLLLQYSNEDGTKPYSQILINLKGDTLKVRPNYLRFTLKDGWMSFSVWENLNYWYKNEFYSKQMQNDTLFCFTEKRFPEPYYIFYTSDKGVTPEVRSNGLYFSNHSEEYMQIQKILESDSYFLYTLVGSKSWGSYIINKHSGAKYSIDKKNWLADDISGGVNFEPQYCNNGIFYSWIDAVNLKQYFSAKETGNKNVKNSSKNTALLKLVSGLSEYDNPVLISVKVK